MVSSLGSFLSFSFSLRHVRRVHPVPSTDLALFGYNSVYSLLQPCKVSPVVLTLRKRKLGSGRLSVSLKSHTGEVGGQDLKQVWPDSYRWTHNSVLPIGASLLPLGVPGCCWQWPCILRGSLRLPQRHPRSTGPRACRGQYRSSAWLPARPPQSLTVPWSLQASLSPGPG